jgi:4-hydroxybenzoyl-CoA reductase subunit alpha
VRPEAGHGTPQSRFGQEVQLDKIAERLQIDPADCGCDIVAPPDSLTANYMRVRTIGLAECIQRWSTLGWKDKFRQAAARPRRRLACSSYLSGAGLPINWNDLPHSGVQLKLDRSGGVTAFCGATEIGQGSDDVLVGVVAEVLGIDPFDVRAVTGDTDLTPVDLGSYSSRVTLMMVNAANPGGGTAREIVASAVCAQARGAGVTTVLRRTRVFDAERRTTASPSRKPSASRKRARPTIGTTGSYTPPKVRRAATRGAASSHRRPIRTRRGRGIADVDPETRDG